MHFQDQLLPDITQKWNIKILNLHRNKRHQDVSVQNEFWNDIEAFLKKEKFQGMKLGEEEKDKNEGAIKGRIK